MNTTKRILLIVCAMLMATPYVLAQNDEDTRNKAVITTYDGDHQLITDEISVIRFDGPKVTVVQPWGDTVFDRTLRSLTFLRPLPGTLRLTVNLSKDDDAGTTRGHSLNGDGALLSTWSENDRVYVYTDDTSDSPIGTLTPVTTGGQVSKMSGDINAAGLSVGNTLYLSTQPRATHSFATQTGAVDVPAMFYLTTTAEVTSITGANATTADATFALAQAIVCFTLKDGSNNDVSAYSLVITGGTETITVTREPAEATNVLYVAMPAAASTSYRLTAIDADGCEWTGSKTAKLDNKYYTTTVTMTKKTTPTVTAPTANTLTYNGSAQALVTAGSTSGGVLQYSLTSGSGYSTTIPTATDAGDYTVYYKVVGDYTYTDVAESSVNVTISRFDLTNATAASAIADQQYAGAQLTPDAPAIKMGETAIDAENYDVSYGDNNAVGTGTVIYTAKAESANFTGTKTVGFNITAGTLTGITATAYTGTYDGAAHGITVNGIPDGATVTYCETESGTYVLDNFTYTDATAERTVYYKVSKTNYADFTGSSTVTITQASNSFTTQPTIEDWTYGQSANAPTGGVVEFGDIVYKYCTTANGEYGTYDAIVSGQAGTWYVKGFVDETMNYAAAESNAIEFTISAAAASVTAPAAVDGALTYSGSAQTLFIAGSSNDGTLKYKVTTTSDKPTSKDGFIEFGESISKGTNAGTYYLWYYVSGNANHNDTEINTVAISKAIAKATATKTDPVAKTDLAFTGNAQALATGGSSEHGTFTYCATLDGDYTTTIPTGTDYGTDYAVYWKFTGDANHNDDSGSLTGITIAKVAASVTILPAAVTGDLTYNGSAQTLFSAGTSNDGTLKYKVTTTSDQPSSKDGFIEFGESTSKGTNAGTYYLWYYVSGNANHNDTEINTVAISKAIGKKSLTVTAEAKSKDYGADNPTLTYIHGDLATGDNESVFTGALACTATTTSEPGEYDITQGTLSAGDNYEITYTGAKLTVNLLDMSSGVTVTPYSAAYDGSAHGIAIVLSGEADGATITYCDTENGTYRAENYTYSDVAAARTVWYKIEKEHYTTIAGSSTVTITQASNSFTTQPTITGWTYGSAANAPTGGVVEFGEIVYKYCATENGEYGTYDAIVNGQAGTWYVKGFVEATTNYAAATSNAVSFTISAAAGSISYTTPAVEKTLAAPAFTNSLTKVGDGTVSYARSAGDDICTVNATTGLVTLNGTVGTCTITATVANSTNYSYDTHTASYTLTVLPVLDLSMVTANMTVPHGVTVTGTLGGNYKISIAEDATVTLSNAIIERGSNSNWQWAGLNCVGDATIILADGTTNTVKGFHENYPGIHIPSGNTLTIKGTGALNASSNGKGAGIGGGRNIDCGNIIINGGTITANGGSYAAGIGCGGTQSGSPSCGDITINGGEITATGGTRGAGIGCAFTNGSCGNITISGGTVEATGGNNGGAGIGGGGYNGRCGDITISGGEVTATGGGGEEGATGIGGGRGSSYNSITISGGTVIANGGTNGAGIGSGYCANGGDILISGGTVTATGSGSNSVGIGAGYGSNYHCGNITIKNTVTRVTATKSANAVHSIGICYNGRSNCGTVTIGGVTGAISTSPYIYPKGALSGKFTVNGSGGKVLFSQGNLQLTAANTWEFADNQYDYFGGSQSDNHRDLFGWGTGNNPNQTSGSNGDYSTFTEWGNNSDLQSSICTGWRTLTTNEWQYIFNTRSTTSGVRYVMATVNGESGVILLPDDWSTSYYDLESPNTSIAAFNTNIITSDNWNNYLAAYGAVFLPAAGHRYNSSVSDVGSYGYYWSSSPHPNDTGKAYRVLFSASYLETANSSMRYRGCSVRLVRDVN